MLRRPKRPDLARALFTNFIFAFLFFTFIAQTKVHTYTFLVSSIGFISIACFFEWMFSLSRKISLPWLRYFIIGFVALGVALITFRPYEINYARNNRWEKHYHDAKKKNTLVWKSLAPGLDKNTVLINLRSYENIEAQFYTNNPSLKWWPKEKQIDSLIEKGFSFLVLPYSGAWHSFPDFLRNKEGVSIYGDHLLPREKE